MIFNVVIGMKIQSIKALVTIEFTKNTECCQTVDTFNYFPTCFKQLKSMSDHDNISCINDAILRTVNIDADVITEFNSKLNSDDSEDLSITQSVISNSCDIGFNKLNNFNLSDDSCGGDKDALPKTIGFLKSVIY